MLMYMDINAFELKIYYDMMSRYLIKVEGHATLLDPILWAKYQDYHHVDHDGESYLVMLNAKNCYKLGNWIPIRDATMEELLPR